MFKYELLDVLIYLQHKKTTNIMYWWRRWDMSFHAFVMALTISWTLKFKVPRRIIRNVYLPSLVRISYLSTTKLAAYKSIDGCWITPHTTRYCLTALLPLKTNEAQLRFHR